jgi:hypothetical protein
MHCRIDEQHGFRSTHMVIARGKKYYTITDASLHLGVSVKTVRDYIRRGIIPEPPEINYGLRNLKYFTTKYLDLAKLHLNNFREMKYWRCAHRKNIDPGAMIESFDHRLLKYEYISFLPVIFTLNDMTSVIYSRNGHPYESAGGVDKRREERLRLAKGPNSLYKE